MVTQLDTEQVRLLGQQFAKNGWVLARGGRFYTLLSAQADKGRAMQWLVKVFAQNLPEMPVLAAIGDSPNDFPLLAAADFPFLVQRQDGSWADLELPGLTKVDGIGPAGFSAAIRMLTGD
ncbi:MAG: hypothetical protein IPH31_15350 [Lewinellaceae bacterium]|nr:hypothetical protein [Lewinellaceae bacterium]